MADGMAPRRIWFGLARPDRPVACRRSALPQTIADHKDDAAQHTLIITTRHPIRQGKNGDVRAIWAVESRFISVIKAAPLWCSQ